MKCHTFSRVFGRGLFFAVMLFTGQPAWTQDTPGSTAAEVQAPPFDVLNVRRQYYTDLDQAKKEAIRETEAGGLRLSYHPDGTVVKDDAYQKVTGIYNIRRQELLQMVRTDRRREDAVNALFDDADIKLPKEADTGTRVESKEYSGALSDRDVTLKGGVVGLQAIERLKVVAKEKGYHVLPGTGYVKIPELDMIVWEPSEDNERRTFNKQDKAIRFNDPEVVLEIKDPSVTSQIHKVEHYYRERSDLPDSTQDEFEMIASLAKAAYKSVKAVDPDAKTGAVVSQEEFKQLELLKSRKLTVDDLVDPLDRPEVKKQKLKDLMEKNLRIVQKCLPLDEQQRDAKIQQVEAEAQRLREKAWQLEQKRKELPEGTDPAEEKRLFDELQEVLAQKENQRVELNTLNRKKDMELAQQKIIVAKNSAMRSILKGADPTRDASTPSEPGAATKIGRALENEGPPKEHASSDLDKAREGFSFWSTVISVTEAVTESKTLKALNKNLGPLSEINQIAGGIEGFNYETGEGMREYVRREIDRYKSQGYDIDNNPRLQAEIYRNAILRATGRATWEGSKILPVLGNLVQGAEDFYHLSESSTGLAYDRWKRQQIEDANRIVQEGNLQRAVSHAKTSRDKLRDMLESAKGYAKETRQLAELKLELDAEQQALEQEIVTRFALLESLAASDGANKQLPLASPVSEETLRPLAAAIAAETKLTQIFIRDCEKAIERVKEGGLPREDVAEEQGGLKRRLMDVDTEYFRLTTLLEQARQSVRLITDVQDAQQYYQTFLEIVERARTLAKIEEDRADRMQDAITLFGATLRAFAEEKTRIKNFCDGFAVRAADDDGLKRQLNSIRDEIAGFHINSYELDDFKSLPGEMKRNADRLVLMLEKNPPVLPQVALPNALLEKTAKTQVLLRELEQPAVEMTRVVEIARERFRQLRDLYPLDAPVLTLTAKEAANLTYDFVVAGSRLPIGAKIKYWWDFGDEQEDATENSTYRHVYAKPGKYTVRVVVVAERLRVSELLGETSITIGRDTPPPATTDANQKQVQLIFDIPGRTKLDFAKRPAHLVINDDKMTLDLVQDINDYPNRAPIKVHLEGKINRQNGQINVEGTFAITETWDTPNTKGEYKVTGIIRGNVVGTRLNLTAIDKSQAFTGAGSSPQNIVMSGRRIWVEGFVP